MRRVPTVNAREVAAESVRPGTIGEHSSFGVGSVAAIGRSKPEDHFGVRNCQAALARPHYASQYVTLADRRASRRLRPLIRAFRVSHPKLACRRRAAATHAGWDLSGCCWW